MAAKTIKIPTIDFSKPELKPGTPEWDSTKKQVRQALEDYGAIDAFFDKIPAELQKAILDASTELFELPLEAKNRPNCGYIPRSTLYPLFESLSIEETTIPESVDHFTKALWPENNPAFSETVLSYSLKLSELDQMIRRMVLESLEVEQYTDEHLQSAKYIVRVNRYDGPKTEETKLMALPHTDKNFITILHQNQVGGLQVQTKDGQWIDASFSPNSYIVMVGDSLHAWTNGRVHAPLHQVVLSGNETRYSLGLFSVPKVGCTIKAPEEIVDDEHPLLFKPFDYYEYLAFFRTEVRFKTQFPLKKFCGI